MAMRIAVGVVRGEIDNRIKGRVTGRLWVLGREEPIELDLKGNAHPDAAGTLLTFENPAPGEGDSVLGLGILQVGRTGDITATRRVRKFLVPVDQALAMMDKGESPPEVMADCLYVEWFSSSNGRVVIETTDFNVSVSEHSWHMTPEEAEKQAVLNATALTESLDRAVRQFALNNGEQVDEERKDEFEWEKLLQESDRRNDKYGELLDRYKDHPDQDRIVAREMGWTEILEALDEEAAEEEADEDDGEMAEGDEDDEDEMEGGSPYEFEDDGDVKPNPLTEGKDWAYGRHGHIEHPLAIRTMDLSLAIRSYAMEHDAMHEGGDGKIRELIFKLQMTGAKLAGGLNSLAYDTKPDGGFIVAYLKRALNFLHEALNLVDPVLGEGRLEAARMERFRQEMFTIREEILALMRRFRAA